MKTAGRIKLALALLDQHKKKYGVRAPKRLVAFFENGEAFNYEEKCLPKGTKAPGFEPGSFRLVVAPPSWDAASTVGGLDDAVVGPEGDWEWAKDYLPIFQAEQSRYLVVRLGDPKCAVGWFEEEAWDQDTKGYKQGIWPMAKSLDEFLKTLVTLDKVDYETDIDEELWDEVASALEDEDEDDDDDDDDDDEDGDDD
jgi:hypothetical protein